MLYFGTFTNRLANILNRYPHNYSTISQPRWVLYRDNILKMLCLHFHYFKLTIIAMNRKWAGSTMTRTGVVEVGGDTGPCPQSDSMLILFM